MRKMAVSGSGGWFSAPKRVLSMRVVGHLCRMKQLGAARFRVAVGEHSIGHAGDEVADVARAAKRGHGLGIGFVCKILGLGGILVVGEGRHASLLRSQAATKNCSVAGRCGGWIGRFGFGCDGLFGG